MTVSKTIPTELLDSLLSGYQKPEDLIGENGLLKQSTKALVDRACPVSSISSVILISFSGMSVRILALATELRFESGFYKAN